MRDNQALSLSNTAQRKARVRSDPGANKLSTDLSLLRDSVEDRGNPSREDQPAHGQQGNEPAESG